MHNYFRLVGGATFDLCIGRPDLWAQWLAHYFYQRSNILLLHSNLDRLWAEWQSDGHAGSDYYHRRRTLWRISTTVVALGRSGVHSRESGYRGMSLLLPVLSPDDIVTAADTLDFGTATHMTRLVIRFCEAAST